MITGFHHIGLVVKDVEATIRMLSAVADVSVLIRSEKEVEGELAVLISVGNQKLELMQPMKSELGEHGELAQFLRMHGETTHHIALLSDNFEKDCEGFQNAGATMLSVQKNESRCYAKVQCSDGLLFEIIQLLAIPKKEAEEEITPNVNEVNPSWVIPY